MNTIHQKPSYIQPELDIYEYVVERGFEESIRSRVANSETVSELQENTRSENGENYHGEWF